MRLLACCAVAAAVLRGAASAELSFAALGDTAYQLPRDYAPYERLIREINRSPAAFAIHVGDAKGYSDCGDAALETIRDYFNRFERALVFSPGDNDWADCAGAEAGGYDPLERLSAVRRIFFSGPRSMGRRPIALERQSDSASHAAYVENARWRREGVYFATVHITGPHNNFVMTDPRFALDAIDRAKAGEAWINETFRLARTAKAPAVVIAFQIDPFTTGASPASSAPIYESGPVRWLRDAIERESSNFAGEVLIIHGDGHRLQIDQPFRRADIQNGTTSNMNITRLHVPGWPDHRAVLVTVEPETPGVFSFKPLFPEGN